MSSLALVFSILPRSFVPSDDAAGNAWTQEYNEVNDGPDMEVFCG